MIAVSFLQWWYSRGWSIFWQGFRQRMSNIADFFSIGLLLRTLCQPFRQISANTSSNNGGPQAALSAFFDRALSRVIGTCVRIGVIILGIITMTATTICGVLLGVFWPTLPFMPLAGLVMALTGVAF